MLVIASMAMNLVNDRYEEEYDEQEEEYDENVMMVASMARCLITTLVRQTPRSLLDPGKLERDEKEWIFGKYLFRRSLESISFGLSSC